MMYLKKLGLPEYEAHTYVCLLQAVSRPLRKSLTVSMSLQPRVYDALDELSQKGFVNVQPG